MQRRLILHKYSNDPTADLKLNAHKMAIHLNLVKNLRRDQHQSRALTVVITQLIMSFLTVKTLYVGGKHPSLYTNMYFAEYPEFFQLQHFASSVVSKALNPSTNRAPGAEQSAHQQKMQTIRKFRGVRSAYASAAINAASRNEDNKKLDPLYIQYQQTKYLIKRFNIHELYDALDYLEGVPDYIGHRLGTIL